MAVKQTTSQSKDATTAQTTATAPAAKFGLYAMISNKTNVVHDKLECLNTFTMNNYFFVAISRESDCEKGQIYNAADGSFSTPVVEEDKTQADVTTASKAASTQADTTTA